jgi:uncharacterized cupredoxin-like copper-binding protein
MKQLTTCLLMMFATIAVASLSLVPAADARVERESTASTTTISVKAREFLFRLSTKSIARPGTVRFVVKNVGSLEHDFSINHKRTPLIKPGKTATLTVRFATKGRFIYRCTVAGHAAAGMKGVFTVR